MVFLRFVACFCISSRHYAVWCLHGFYLFFNAEIHEKSKRNPSSPGISVYILRRAHCDGESALHVLCRCGITLDSHLFESCASQTS
jgi:hypothetical protein